jgi:2,3-bisphosphoglycerate-dependent phosphoglycerate mutase
MRSPPTATVLRSAPFKDSGTYDWKRLRDTLSAGVELPHAVALHLFRHGETVTNARGLITGAQDVPLTERGRQQAREIGRKLDAHYSAAFCSALTRSKQTLDLARAGGNVEVDVVFTEARLNERSLGRLELAESCVLSGYAKGDLNYAPEDGDTYARVARRALSFALDLCRWIRASQADKILICGHAGPMRIMVGILEECADPIAVLARDFQNTEIVRYDWQRLVMPKFLKAART